MKNQYIVRISPDCEWADSATLHASYPTREGAIAAVRADEILTPDEYGQQPHPSVVAVDEAGRVPECTCYGRFACAACTLAMMDGRVK